MNEYYEIKASLIHTFEKAGLSMSEEKITPQSFGAACSVFSGKGLTYRINWDGKDGCGYIQSLVNESWVDLNPSIPKNEHPAFEVALIRMRVALIEHIALAKLSQNKLN